MPSFRVRSAAEQVADHLRRELTRGAWSGMMPGGASLSRRLGVGRMTIEGALDTLEKEGLLVSQGARRRRRIVLPEDGRSVRPLRLHVLFYEEDDMSIDYLIDLQHQLKQAGHAVNVAPRTMRGMDMDPQRVARMVAASPGDAWVVVAGSVEILGWFAGQSLPAFALFGRMRDLRLPGAAPDKRPAEAAAVRRLIELGHRRIVQLARRERRLPKPGTSEQAFLDTLAAHGIEVGPYHLPEWDETGAGFHQRIEAMFRHTPPTAIIFQEAAFFFAAFQALMKLGLKVPEDVSLVCTDQDSHFAWFRPSVSHIRWDPQPVIRRVVRWAANVSRGREDFRQAFAPADFVVGGTIGPVKRVTP